MTQKEIIDSFLEDPIIEEKTKNEEIKKKILSLDTGIKVLEVLKIAVNGQINEDAQNLIARRMNQYLNK